MIMSLNAFYEIYTPSFKYSMKIPDYTKYKLVESQMPTIILASGSRIYHIGLIKNRFQHKWDTFVSDHALQHGNVLLFLPQSRTSLAVLIFGTNGIEIMYPWHCTFNV